MGFDVFFGGFNYVGRVAEVLAAGKIDASGEWPDLVAAAGFPVLPVVGSDVLYDVAAGVVDFGIGYFAEIDADTNLFLGGLGLDAVLEYACAVQDFFSG